jgi:hypothetical protein
MGDFSSYLEIRNDHEGKVCFAIESEALKIVTQFQVPNDSNDLTERFIRVLTKEFKKALKVSGVRKVESNLKIYDHYLIVFDFSILVDHMNKVLIQYQLFHIDE